MEIASAEMNPYIESITKAWQGVKFVIKDLKDAHATAQRESEEMLLCDMIQQAVQIEGRLTRLVREGRGDVGENSNDETPDSSP